MYFPIIDALKESYIAKIPSIVTKWLTDNVNPVGSAVVVDESLSISGAAADAKKTGDELSDLKSDFNLYDAMEGYLLSAFSGNFAVGGLDGNGALLPSQKYRVSSSSPITLDYDVHIKPFAGFRFGWDVIVNGTSTWSGWKTEETTIPSGTNFALQLARVSEVTSETASVSEFTSSYIIRGKLLDWVESTKTFVERELEQDFTTLGTDYPVVVGTWENGVFNNWVRRLTCEAPISVRKGVTVKFLSPTLKINLFMSSGQNSGWISPSNEEKEFVCNSDGLLYIILGKTDDAVITASEYDSTVKIYNTTRSDINKLLDIGENVDDLVADVFGEYASTYYGEAFQSKVNGFNSTKLMTISYSGTSYTLNDIAAYGDYILFFLNPGTIYVYQISTKEKVGEIVVGTQHFACAMFSDTFYDSSDPFPLLYADTTSDGIYNVIRFTSLTSATIIKNYKFDTTLYGTSPQVSFDFMNNRAYCVGYDVTTSNKYKLFTFDMASETENQDGSFSFAEISSGTFPFYQTRQGNTFFNNRMFMAFANTSEPFNPKIVSFDCSSGNAVITSLFNTLPFTGEAEGLTVAQIDGKNCILVTDYYNVYKLSF